jgi:hypothetical protein
MEKSLKTELAISWFHVIWSKNIRPKDIWPKDIWPILCLVDTTITIGLYYKHMTIVNDDSSVVSK